MSDIHANAFIYNAENLALARKTLTLRLEGGVLNLDISQQHPESNFTKIPEV